MITRIGILLIALMQVTGTAASDPYSYEIDINYLQTESDAVDRDVTGVAGTWYWQSVQSFDYPLAEAAFVSKASSLSLGFEQRNAELMRIIPLPLSGNPVFSPPAIRVDGGLPPDFDSAVFFTENPPPVLPVSQGISGGEADSLSIAARYVSGSGWIGALSYAQAKDDRSFDSLVTSISSDQQIDSVALTFGKYIGTTTSVTFEYKDVSDEFVSQQTSNGLPSSIPGLDLFFAADQRTKIDSSLSGYTLAAKTLLRRNAYTHKLQAEVGYDVLESSFSSVFTLVDYGGSLSPSKSRSYVKRLGVGYALFPRRDLEVGIGYALADLEHGKQESLSFSVQWFVTHSIAFRAAIISTNANNSFTDSDGFSVAATGRF